MPIDEYVGQSSGAQTFGTVLDVITPDDDNDLPYFYRSILVGETGGVIAIHDANGDEREVFGVAGSEIRGVRPRRILAAGTIATPLFGVR